TLLIFCFALCFGATTLNAQNVTIPDANFKAYLVGDTAINTNGDAEIQCSEATAFSGTISCTNLSITDLTGIEAFTSLTGLVCGNNLLTSLDLTGNAALISLSCPNNQLTSLDLSACTQLTILYFSTNAISSLNLSNCISLIELECYNNQLNTLDVTNNVAITYLKCSGNLLTTIDLTQNINLTELICYGNSLSAIDVGSSAALEYMECQNNSLTSLNVANGNNTNITWLDATNNPNLTCIQVDDITYSTANWTIVGGYIDAIASFSTNCSGVSVNELVTTTVHLFPNPASSSITIKSSEIIESVSIFNSLGELVQQESTASFSINSLPSGIYTIHVNSKNGMVRSQFVKQ
ncbi:MAG: T9SS type A sorting domain-containing protein, partial [Flavobacteriales bacterium]|nr:T9SS type A sorting domain-containing protein [Flavobacteriales bacterium]